jgi:hypothetical protein
MYAFAPGKTPSLAGRDFCLAILRVFAKASKNRGSNSPSNRRSSPSPGIAQSFCPELAKIQYRAFNQNSPFAGKFPWFSG